MALAMCRFAKMTKITQDLIFSNGCFLNNAVCPYVISSSDHCGSLSNFILSPSTNITADPCRPDICRTDWNYTASYIAMIGMKSLFV